jgi:hypothetical protein
MRRRRRTSYFGTVHQIKRHDSTSTSRRDPRQDQNTRIENSLRAKPFKRWRGMDVEIPKCADSHGLRKSKQSASANDPSAGTLTSCPPWPSPIASLSLGTGTLFTISRLIFCRIKPSALVGAVDASLNAFPNRPPGVLGVITPAYIHKVSSLSSST